MGPLWRDQWGPRRQHSMAARGHHSESKTGFQKEHHVVVCSLGPQEAQGKEQETTTTNGSLGCDATGPVRSAIRDAIGRVLTYTMNPASMTTEKESRHSQDFS